MVERKVVAIEEARSWNRNRRAMRYVAGHPDLDELPGLFDRESTSCFLWGFWLGTCFGAGASLLIVAGW